MEMETITGAQDISAVVALIDQVFRERDGLPSTMQQEFPLLFCEENRENMRTLYQDGKVISVASYLPRKILIEGFPISVGSVGGVCTREGFEKRGYSSAVLDNVEQQMISQGIDVMLVSGRRNLYLRRECSIVDGFYEYIFHPQNSSDLHIRKSTPQDLDKMMRFYNSNSTRFHRSKEDFDSLLKAAIVNQRLGYSHNSYVVEENGQVIGYIVLTECGNGKGIIQEAMLSPGRMGKALRHIANQANMESVSIFVHKRDTALSTLDYDDRKDCPQSGTVKILRYGHLMQALQPYFAQYLTKQELEGLQFAELPEGNMVQYGQEVYRFPNISEVNQMVMGEQLPPVSEKFQAILRKIFPIPMPNTGNLNFQ